MRRKEGRQSRDALDGGVRSKISGKQQRGRTRVGLRLTDRKSFSQGETSRRNVDPTPRGVMFEITDYILLDLVVIDILGIVVQQCLKGHYDFHIKTLKISKEVEFTASNVISLKLILYWKYRDVIRRLVAALPAVIK